jgi:hypothetical protein
MIAGRACSRHIAYVGVVRGLQFFEGALNGFIARPQVFQAADHLDFARGVFGITQRFYL